MRSATVWRGHAAPRARAAAGSCLRGGSLALAAVLLGCSASAPSRPGAPDPEPGYPEATSRLTLRLRGELQKLCHATLVDRRWALTAAHCFSDVEPEGRGAFNDFDRGVLVRNVVLHPLALRSGSTRIDRVWQTSDFVAAHDLALVPIDPPLDTIAPVARWLPLPGCSFAAELGVPGRFGQLGPNNRAQTVEANLIGTVTAASLLGPEHAGSLLSAQGPSVGPGDSGSGVSSDWHGLELRAEGCAPDMDANEGDVLIGVIQDANVERPSSPFGLTPLYPYDHSRWLATTIETTPAPAEPERPRLDF